MIHMPSFLCPLSSHCAHPLHLIYPPPFLPFLPSLDPFPPCLPAPPHLFAGPQHILGEGHDVDRTLDRVTPVLDPEETLAVIIQDPTGNNVTADQQASSQSTQQPLTHLIYRYPISPPRHMLLSPVSGGLHFLDLVVIHHVVE